MHKKGYFMTNATTAWINGKTLKTVLEKKRSNHDFGKFSSTDRVPIDISRDACMLGIGAVYGVPFVIDDYLFVTIHDFDLSASAPRLKSTWNEIISLANLHFSRHALVGALQEFFYSEPGSENLTKKLENLAQHLDLEEPDEGFRFSRQVIKDWGRGDRVWGNLERKHTSAGLGRLICEWLKIVKASNCPAEALGPGVQIKGLGVSFASKHLRLFDPERFATLDEIICNTLGYARNLAGYNLWLYDLTILRNKLEEKYNLTLRIADIESAIFLMARQMARSKFIVP
jgi:hypothetical protein